MRALTLSVLVSAFGACDASAPPPGPSSPTSGKPAADPQVELTQRRARAIRAAATEWRAQHAAGTCPTVAALKADRNLDALADDLDAQGHELVVVCTPTETRVSSLLPDGSHAASDIEAEPAPVPLSKAPPPPAATYTAPVSDAPVALGAVAAAMDRVLRLQIDPRVHDCYLKVLGREPKPEERVAGTLTVAADGSVKKASLTSATPNDPLARCVAEAIEKAKFEPSPGGADRTVRYP